MRKAYYKLAVREPGAVAWYCALKLEMAVSLVKAMLTEQMRSDEVPGRDEAKAKLAEDLASRLGEEVVVDDVPDLQQFGYVDDYYVSFEWSNGGMIHCASRRPGIRTKALGPPCFDGLTCSRSVR